MKILSTLSSIALLSFITTANTEDISLDALNVNLKPHSINIYARDKISEVEGITDSNTAPIEDTRVASKTTEVKKAAKNIIDTDSFGKLGSADLNSDDNTPPASYKASSSDYSTLSSSAIKSSQDSKSTKNDQDASNSNPFLMAISMIIVSEIGDKTFLISALMAMRNNRMVVFSASFASLAVMTILSGIVGHTLPTLLSPRLTQFLAAGLFVVFGIKLTKEGLAMSRDLGVEEELAEVEEEIDMEFNDIENGRLSDSHHDGSFLSKITHHPQIQSVLYSLQDIASITFSPLWIQVFIMIFLGEWGDRSQIATIAMAAGSNYWAVISGAVIGHGLCTAAAVIGGKMLATKISMRNVTLGGAFAFFVFAILYLLEATSPSTSE